MSSTDGYLDFDDVVVRLAVAVQVHHVAHVRVVDVDVEYSGHFRKQQQQQRGWWPGLTR